MSEQPAMKCDICTDDDSRPVILDHWYGGGSCRQCGTRYEYDECQQIVLTADQRALLRNPPRWIPVSERLPDEDVRVLVIDKEFDQVDIGTCWGRGEWVGDHISRLLPTHWMPLPKMPAEKP